MSDNLKKWKDVIDFESNYVQKTPEHLREPLANLLQAIEDTIGGSWYCSYKRALLPYVRYNLGLEGIIVAKIWYDNFDGDLCYILDYPNFLGEKIKVALPFNMDKAEVIPRIHSFTIGYNNHVPATIKLEYCDKIEILGTWRDYVLRSKISIFN